MPLSRYARGVRLNVRGREYAQEIQRTCAALSTASERHREHAYATHLKLVAVDVWIAFTDRVAETLHVKTLFEETLIPVWCQVTQPAARPVGCAMGHQRDLAIYPRAIRPK